MRVNGVSEDDRRDRGNNVPGSQIMNDTYDYAMGLGPLASNSLPGACQPTVPPSASFYRIEPLVWMGDRHRCSRLYVTRFRVETPEGQTP